MTADLSAAREWAFRKARRLARAANKQAHCSNRASIQKEAEHLRTLIAALDQVRDEKNNANRLLDFHREECARLNVALDHAKGALEPFAHHAAHYSTRPPSYTIGGYAANGAPSNRLTVADVRRAAQVHAQLTNTGADKGGADG